MKKSSVGFLVTATSLAIIFGYNINIVTGIVTFFAVSGIMQFITGIVEDVLKLIIKRGSL